MESCSKLGRYWQKNRDLVPAVCYGLDRQAIIDAVLLGQGMPAYGPLQRNVYNCEDVEHYDYNPEKSKEILEAAGCEWVMTDSTTATAKKLVLLSA